MFGRPVDLISFGLKFFTAVTEKTHVKYSGGFNARQGNGLFTLPFFFP